MPSQHLAVEGQGALSLLMAGRLSQQQTTDKRKKVASSSNVFFLVFFIHLLTSLNNNSLCCICGGFGFGCFVLESQVTDRGFLGQGWDHTPVSDLGQEHDLRSIRRLLLIIALLNPLRYSHNEPPGQTVLPGQTCHHLGNDLTHIVGFLGNLVPLFVVALESCMK